jgi:hypothetical protein
MRRVANALPRGRVIVVAKATTHKEPRVRLAQIIDARAVKSG